MTSGVSHRTEKFKKNLKNYWNKHQHPLFKGDSANYSAKHARIKRRYGKADRCENKKCKGLTKFYEWANKSGLYKPERSDWIKLCRSCHRKYDETKEKNLEHSKRMKKYWEGNDKQKKRYALIAKKQYKSRLKNNKGQFV